MTASRFEETCCHEARHVVILHRLRWTVTGATAHPDGDPRRLGVANGLARSVTTLEDADRLAVESTMVRLAGYMTAPPVEHGHHTWPPSWADARACRLEGLGDFITRAEVSAETYRRAAFELETLLEVPAVMAEVELIAQALAEVRELDTWDVSALLGPVSEVVT